MRSQGIVFRAGRTLRGSELVPWVINSRHSAEFTDALGALRIAIIVTKVDMRHFGNKYMIATLVADRAAIVPQLP